MGVVDQAVEDGIGVGRIADQRMPLVDRDLACDDGRAPAVAFFEDLEEVVAGAGIERLKTPVVEDQQLDAGEGAQQAGIAAVAAGQSKIGKELGDALVGTERLSRQALWPSAGSRAALR